MALAPDVGGVLERHREQQAAEAAHLGAAWPTTDLVFTSRVGTNLGQRGVTRTWHTLQAKAGVPRARMHDLRHLHVSLLVEQGVDPRTIADRVGHARASFTLDVDTHLFGDSAWPRPSTWRRCWVRADPPKP